MKVLSRESRILKVFITRTCKLKFEEIKNKIKNFNQGNIAFYHVGDDYNLMELMRFHPDVVVSDFDAGEIYIRHHEVLKKENPF